MAEEQNVILVKSVTKRLVTALLLLIAVSAAVLIAYQMVGAALPLWPLCTVWGVAGGFISVQRRLKRLGPKDLTILSESWPAVFLAPFAGGILAVVLLMLFVSGLLTGELFPAFDPGETTAKDFSRLVECTAESHQDYAKLIFWSFVAGFSESFVTNIIGRFSDPVASPPNKT